MYVDSEDQKQTFEDRINRIRSQRGHVPVEPMPADLQTATGEWEIPKSEAPRKEIDLVPGWKENVRYPLGIVAAFVLGMLAVLLSRYVRFHLQGGTLTGEDPDITMMIDAGLAAGVAFALRIILKFEDKEHIFAKTMGIAVMVVTMHNLVHWAPGLFSVLFSVDWVDDVVLFTDPNSILFRGMSFVLIEPQVPVAPEEAPIVPRVFYVD
ncbi:MAG: hypothetical protein AAFR35_12690 [Pseudomonadota bacterium]